MKRILLATIITIGIGHIAEAQTSGSNANNGPSVSSSRAKAKTQQGKKGQADSLSDREMYNWKDGQRATPTGHEATGLGESAAPLPKDSARLQGDSTRRYR